MKKSVIINENSLLKINLNTLSENYENLKKNVQPADIAAVLKSNCYGLGIEKISKRLIELGCKNFFLTCIEESILVKEKSKQSNVFLLNGIINLSNNNIRKVIKKNIIPVINSYEELKKFNQIYDCKNRYPLCLHFDTAINRLGIPKNEIKKVFNYCDTNNINVFCIMSHFASADEPKSSFNQTQLNRFKKIIKMYPKAIYSIANSEATLNLQNVNYDIVRSGGCLFGTVNKKIYKKIIQLFAKVLQIKKIDSSHQIFGYNGTYQSKTEKKIAIIGFGYADGYPRLLSNNAFAFFKKKLPIIGSISMDYMIIDISSLNKDELKIGDFVELIGNNISINDLAKAAETIPYEILNNIGIRVKKIYIDNV
mgnify:CR=1 FL=1